MTRNAPSPRGTVRDRILDAFYVFDVFHEWFQDE
jgi:hypothetical protein